MGITPWTGHEEGAFINRGDPLFAEDKKAPPQLQVAPLQLMSALSGLSSQSSLPNPDSLSHSLSSSPTQQTKPQWKRSGLDMYEYANLARSSGPL